MVARMSECCHKLGFRHIGEQMHEIDGKELVFEVGL
jgi:hypothetical protein